MISLQGKRNRRLVLQRHPYMKDYLKGKPLHLAYFLSYPAPAVFNSAEDDPGSLETEKDESKAV